MYVSQAESYLVTELVRHESILQGNASPPTAAGLKRAKTYPAPLEHPKAVKPPGKVPPEAFLWKVIRSCLQRLPTCPSAA